MVRNYSNKNYYNKHVPYCILFKNYKGYFLFAAIHCQSILYFRFLNINILEKIYVNLVYIFDIFGLMVISTWSERDELAMFLEVKVYKVQIMKAEVIDLSRVSTILPC